MDRLIADVRVALRGFLRTPSFTATAIVVLAVGIGMAVAMFTVFDAVLVRSLPLRDQDHIVELYTYRADPKADYWLTRPDLAGIARQAHTVSDIAGFTHWGTAPGPMIDGDRPIVLNWARVTGNFFDVLGTRAALGRLLRPSDEVATAQRAIVISYGEWQHQFGGDSGIIGRRLTQPYLHEHWEIIGVAPPGLDYPSGVEMWTAFPSTTDETLVKAFARLTPGSAPGAAQSELFGIAKTLHPERGYGGVHVQTLTRAITGDVKPVLMALAAAVALLLLIACVNVGNLLLVRAASRAREISIRRAMGASRGDLLRQLAIESILLGVAGGALGLVAAESLVRSLVVNAPPGLPRLDSISVAGAPLAIALTVTAVAVLLFGIVPALVGSHADVAATLRFDSRAGTETRTRRAMRQALVASQVALALVMLAGAGLLGRTLARLENVALGFDAQHLALLTVSFPPNVPNDSAGQFQQSRLYALGEQLQTAWKGVPGVRGVTPILAPPYLGANIFVGRLDQPGQSAEELKSNPVFPVEVGGAAYFNTFDIPVKSGRTFTNADNETAPRVVIVSEAVAKRMWPNENPVGKRVRYWDDDTAAFRTIVGVAGDIRWRSLREPNPSVYVPWRQSYWQGSFAVRTVGGFAGMVAGLRRATHEVNPEVTLWQAKPMNDALAQPLAQPKLSALLLGGFALASMFLAALGLYGVMASTVRASTREFGVRIALGASPGRLRRHVLLQALVVTGIGAAAGIVAALSASRLLASLLFEISPTDPVSLIGAAVALLVVALLAAYIPAYRATKVDPVEALRAD